MHAFGFAYRGLYRSQRGRRKRLADRPGWGEQMTHQAAEA
jgi:hypothetical protein